MHKTDVASNFSMKSRERETPQDEFKTINIFNVMSDLNVFRESLINIIESYREIH